MVSPLDFIKQFSGQDPSLTQRTVEGAEALDALRKSGSITRMQQSGENLRNAATIAGSLRQSALLKNLALAPEELQPGAGFSAATTEDVGLRQRLQNALTGSEAFDAARSAGVVPKRVAGPEGKLIPPTFTLGSAGDMEFVSGAPTKGAAAEIAKIDAKRGSRTKQEYYAFDDSGRYTKFTKEEYFERIGQRKGGSPALIAEAKQLSDDARRAYGPDKKIVVTRDPQTDKLILTVDGVQKERDI